MTELLPSLALVLLLACSGFFSASETAIFSLEPDEVERAGPRVGRLLADPRAVLVTLLLGNLIVNLVFFVSAPRLFDHGWSELVVGVVALISILIFGEIVPKTLALRAPVGFARAAALPVAAMVVVATPVRRLVSVFLDGALRLLGESAREERGISPEALARALEHSADEGLLAAGEADLLAEIVELGDLRVREIMSPRVDVLWLDLDASEDARAAVLKDAGRRRLTWLPVIRGGADNVVGRVDLRDVFARLERPIEQVVMPIKFVPEVASALAFLQAMREDRVAEAVVVDEWGGTAGAVTLEDLFEELVGELRVEGEEVPRPVVPLGEGRFRVSGGLSIRDWNEQFGMRVVPTEFETVGGYVTALLGRIPRSGDRVELGGGIVCEVHDVRGRRVRTLDLSLEVAAPVEAGTP